jgi:RimJ/RimL family protein N-acetyltransferase
VLINVGFAEDGVLPHGATVGGEPVDVLGYVLDREQWELRKPA